MINPTDLPTLKSRLRALLADTPHPAHPHVSPADLTAILDELDAGESERARHAEEVARLEAAHLSETRALDDLRLKEIRSLRDQLRRTEGARDVATRVAADHFGTICQLRDQLRKVEGERDTLAVRMDLPASQLLMVGSELCGDGKIDPNDQRDPRWTPTLQQAAKVMRELTSLRSLLPDVRACAEYCRNIVIGPPGIPALAARRILAAKDAGEGARQGEPYPPPCGRAVSIDEARTALGLNPNPRPTWLPIDECGELEDGWYDVWVVKPEYDGGAGQLMHARRFPSGEFVVAGLIYEAQHITHVHRMGPIRGPGESSRA